MLSGRDFRIKHKEKRRGLKKLACCYCGKLFSHRISEHLRHMHAEEDVAKALAQKGHDRTRALSIIKNKVNFKDNVKMLEKDR